MKRKYFYFLIMGFIVFCVYFNGQINKPNENVFGAKKFKIEKGQGVADIAQSLHEQGFLKSPFWFKIYVGVSGNKNKFYDGEYELSTDLNIKNLVRELAQKSAVGQKEIEITFLEGWTVAEDDEYLNQKGLIKKGELLNFVKDFDGLQYGFLFGRPKNSDLEGFLYPDTYRIYENAKVEDIVKKMLENFDQKLTQEMRAEIKKQNKSIFEIVTLASIVEKEMFGYENRQKVADIFWKRLKVGMALQSDATINFITNKGVVSPSYADLQVKSAYNTYQNAGLPPGPICNPSIEAIKAVIFPIKNDYWYFLTTPNNEIIFSKNHDEHVINKQKYLK